MTKTHYATTDNGRAICGANQGVKRGNRMVVTPDMTKVTCKICAKSMHGTAAFAAELARRFGVA